jgi:hypothetical protein
VRVLVTIAAGTCCLALACSLLKREPGDSTAPPGSASTNAAEQAQKTAPARPLIDRLLEMKTEEAMPIMRAGFTDTENRLSDGAILFAQWASKRLNRQPIPAEELAVPTRGRPGRPRLQQPPRGDPPE